MPDEHEPEILEDVPEGGPVKSFLEHLEDFRWMLMKCIVSLVVAMIVCLFGANFIMAALKWPLTRARVVHPGTNQIVTVSFDKTPLHTFELTPEQQNQLALGTNRYVTVEVAPAQFGTNRVLTWRVADDPHAAERAQRLKVELVNLSPAGGFVVAFQLAIYTGMVIAAPLMVYYIGQFVFPALRLREKKYFYKGLLVGLGLFFVGVAFCYFVLMPITLSASQLYSQWLGLGAFQWRAEDYISFVCKFMVGMGLGFELPVVILTLVKIGIIDYRTLNAARRYMIVVNLILGAVLTTPEVITQLVMFVPLQLLYEISVLIAWNWARQERASGAAR